MKTNYLEKYINEINQRQQKINRRGSMKRQSSWLNQYLMEEEQYKLPRKYYLGFLGKYRME